MTGQSEPSALHGMSLRLVEVADAEYFRHWSRNDRTRALQAGRRSPLSDEEAKRLVDQIIDGEGTEHIARMIVVNGLTIGNCWLGNIDQTNRTATLGIVVGIEAYRGQGIGTSAVKALVDLGFEVIGLDRIELWALTSNIGAIRTYEKAGFEREGIRRQHILWRGARHDTVLMARLRDR